MADETKQPSVPDIIGWLRMQRDKLNEAISALEALGTIQVDKAVLWGQSKPVTQPEPSSGPIPSGAFFRMSIADAIKKYLAIVKRPKRTREIADALLNGGLTSAAKNPAQPIYNTLLGLHKNDGGIERLQDGTWGLSEWYPGRRRLKAKVGDDGQTLMESEEGDSGK